MGQSAVEMRFQQLLAVSLAAVKKSSRQLYKIAPVTVGLLRQGLEDVRDSIFRKVKRITVGMLRQQIF
jgi:hypothetical protein